jgi:hypothetical protein
MIASEERLALEEVKRLEPMLGKETAARLRRAYLLGDETVRERIFELLDAVKAAVAARHGEDSLFMRPPAMSISASGDLDLGDVIYGSKSMYPIRIKKADMLTHMGIFGSSGYGKTNISYSLIRQLSQNGIPVIIFDFSKRNYRDLVSAGIKNIDIFTVGKNVSPLKFNPLKPPEGILLSQWMKEFSSIFDHAYWLLGGGRHVILKALDAVFRSSESPKLSDVKDWLEKYGSTNMPARERNWLATAERPLESLCFKELGQVFDCSEGILPSEFFSPGKITILELDSLDNSDKSFFIEIMLQWIRDWLLASGARETLKGVIILEEAHHVLNREKSKKLGSESVMDLIFREIRELGMGVVYIDQHPSLVSYPALGNTSTHIYLNLGLDTQHSSDVQDASSMLGLDYEEQGVHIRKLPVGKGFMLCRNSAFPNPFTVSFTEFPIRKGSVTDSDVSRLMKTRNRFLKGRCQMTPSGTNQAQTQAFETPKADIMETAKALQSSEWELIKILGSGQATFASQIYRLVRVSGGIFKKRAEKLMEKGVIGMSSAKIRKNRMNYYYLTELGESIFSSSFAGPKASGTPSIEGSKPKAERMDLKGILETLTEDGWKCSLSESILTIKKGEQNLNIHLKSTLERGGFNPKETFFLCSSEAVKNLTLQQAARLSAEFRRGFTIFISTVKEFEEIGELEEVEFIV